MSSSDFLAIRRVNFCLLYQKQKTLSIQLHQTILWRNQLQYQQVCLEHLKWVSESKGQWEFQVCMLLNEVKIAWTFFSLPETLSKFTPAPESLQEAFAKRKKAFIERSCQRQKEIRNKIHVFRNPENQVIEATLSIGKFPKTFVLVSKRESGLSNHSFSAQVHLWAP